MELPKIKLEQLELEHEAPKTTLPFHLKNWLSTRYGIPKATIPSMPFLEKSTECVKLPVTQASKDMHEPLIPMFFPYLAHTSAAQNFCILTSHGRKCVVNGSSCSRFEQNLGSIVQSCRGYLSRFPSAQWCWIFYKMLNIPNFIQHLHIFNR